MTTSTATLTSFLLDRIAEDEELARAASPGPWHTDADQAEVLAVDEVVVAEGFALSGPQLRSTTRHIARHDPARVLAECEAKRRIIELHAETAGDDDEYSGWRDGARSTLTALTQPYASHPDFRDEWRA